MHHAVQIHRALLGAVLDVHRAVRLDLCQVLLVDGICDVSGGQDCHIHIRHYAIRTTCHAAVEVSCEITIYGYRTVFHKFDRSKTVGFDLYIDVHRLEVEIAVQSQVGAVGAIYGHLVQQHAVMLHHDRFLAQAQCHLVGFVLSRYT